MLLTHRYILPTTSHGQRILLGLLIFFFSHCGSLLASPSSCMSLEIERFQYMWCWVYILVISPRYYKRNDTNVVRVEFGDTSEPSSGNLPVLRSLDWIWAVSASHSCWVEACVYTHRRTYNRQVDLLGLYSTKTISPSFTLPRPFYFGGECKGTEKCDEAWKSRPLPKNKIM
jgi:hypothetical protein